MSYKPNNYDSGIQHLEKAVFTFNNSARKFRDSELTSVVASIRGQITIKQQHWRLPETKQCQDALEILKRWTRAERRPRTLLMDTEYGQMLERTVSGFQICVKTYRSAEPLVASNIHYPGESLDGEFLKRASIVCRLKIRKIHSGNTTNGQTISQLRQSLLEAGITIEEYAALSWSATADMNILWRILEGCEDLAPMKDTWKMSCASGGFYNDKLRVIFQPVNVLQLLRDMLDVGDEPFSYGLGAAHQSLFPNATHRPDHTALNDVIAMEDVMREMLAQAERLGSN
ncbi:hypothetical protein FB567DRAFT_587243 [Paraphoma chrysanthemicola]|uniref:Uncharacterized protein n=1 Tax=Paraphoma chrysanthemicola TaxID=798071 RepID=A0A8K0RMM6_9PLEO|nr:hypothetical protein FB567DRAFT_587243 [Paraphoma chrysanthemicola]